MTFLKTFPLFFVAAALSGYASAETNLKASSLQVPSMSAMGNTMRVQAPRGFTEMCARKPELCETSPRMAASSAIPVAASTAAASEFTMDRGSTSAAGDPYEVAHADVRKQAVGVSDVFDSEALQAALAADAAGGVTGSVEPGHVNAGSAQASPALLIVDGAKPVARAAITRAAPSGDPPQALLDAVNRRVNGMVRQQSDWATYNVEELWNRPVVQGGFLSGDCEDIAIEKRQELIEAGVDPKRLFFGVVYRREIGLHVLLIVSTDRGDLALDSRSPWIQAWNQVPYIWVKRQLVDRPTEWVMVTSTGPGSAPRRVASASPGAMVAAR